MDLCLIAEVTETARSWNDALRDYTNFALTVGMIAVGLGFVIFVHELGHFLAAKACGVKAEKFYIGFDIPMPKLFGWQIPSRFARFQWGETEYGIGILPLGGYVKMLGQDDDPRKYKDEQERARGEGTAAEGLAPLEPIPDKPVYDPRSYQAKSVPQRMLIISAGVIMNLIFAAVMGAAAYSMGVPYTPTVIGGAPAGSPGWAADLQPGDKITRIGANGYEDDQLRWQQDLMPNIMLATGDPVKLQITRAGRSDPFEIEISGRKHYKEDFYLLGIYAASSRVVGKYDTKRLAEEPKALPEPGDRIVSINGVKVPENPEQQGALIQQQLAAHPGETLALEVQRLADKEEKDPEKQVWNTHKLELPPQPLRTLGLALQLGPISAVRKHSPAMSAGMEPGDKILSINGGPIGDPLTLSQRMLEHVGKEDVTVEVERTKEGKKSKKTFKITAAPPVFMENGFDGLRGDMIAVEPFGIAAPVEFQVAEVTPGSPADQAGLKPGDEIVAVEFVIEDEAARQKLHKSKELRGRIQLEQENLNWVSINMMLQELIPLDAKIDLTYRRGTDMQTASALAPVDSSEGFFEPRGLDLAELEKTRTAENFSEAWYLGFRETKEKLVEVGRTLHRLLTGRVSPKNLGSPIMIAQVAYMEASHGWGRLLIFLTFLSANLALINFLPIPVLDGGHMVFLAYEGIRGKPANEQVQYYALLAGAAALLCLMIFVFSNDIWRILT